MLWLITKESASHPLSWTRVQECLKWTRSVLIINKGQCPQDCPPHPANPSKTILSSFCPPLAHWGEPFHCPRQGVRYSSGGCGLSPSMQRDAEGRRSQRVKRKDKVRRRGKSKVGGILEEAVVAKWSIWTATRRLHANDVGDTYQQHRCIMVVCNTCMVILPPLWYLKYMRCYCSK